jgi:hypothetical protein
MEGALTLGNDRGSHLTHSKPFSLHLLATERNAADISLVENLQTVLSKFSPHSALDGRAYQRLIKETYLEQGYVRSQ